MKRLAGFTLVELIVSMALIGMILLMGQYVYMTLTRFHVQFVERIDTTYDSGQAAAMLRWDCWRASDATMEEGELALWDADGSLQARYELADTLLIRKKGSLADTLRFYGYWMPLQPGKIQLRDSLLHLQMNFEIGSGAMP